VRHGSSLAPIGDRRSGDLEGGRRKGVTSSAPSAACFVRMVPWESVPAAAGVGAGRLARSAGRAAGAPAMGFAKLSREWETARVRRCGISPVLISLLQKACWVRVGIRLIRTPRRCHLAGHACH
jgi:hypothetical protein